MTDPTHPLPPADAAAVLAPHHRHADRVFGRTLAVHLGIALAVAPFYGTWAMAVLVGGAAVGMFELARRCYPASLASRAAFGVAAQMFVALHIFYQMHGLAFASAARHVSPALFRSNSHRGRSRRGAARRDRM